MLSSVRNTMAEVLGDIQVWYNLVTTGPNLIECDLYVLQVWNIKMTPQFLHGILWMSQDATAFPQTAMCQSTNCRLLANQAALIKSRCGWGYLLLHQQRTNRPVCVIFHCLAIANVSNNLFKYMTAIVGDAGLGERDEYLSQENWSKSPRDRGFWRFLGPE